MNKKEKRNRATNFTCEEELHLAQEIQKFKQILECKTSNLISSADKENAWNQVLQNYNSYNRPRNLTQIKSKFDNLKTAARKYYTSSKQSSVGTGGGPCAIIKDTKSAIYDILIDILNKRNSSKKYDNTFVQTSEDVIDSDNLLLVERIKSESLEELQQDDVSNAEDRDTAFAVDYDIASSTSNSDISENNANNACTTNITSPSTSRTETNNRTNKGVNYTNKMSKKKVFRKLSSSRRHTSELQTLKAEYLKLKIASIQEERSNRKRRMEMKEEYHKKRLEVLDSKTAVKSEVLE